MKVQAKEHLPFFVDDLHPQIFWRGHAIGTFVDKLASQAYSFFARGIDTGQLRPVRIRSVYAVINVEEVACHETDAFRGANAASAKWLLTIVYISKAWALMTQIVDLDAWAGATRSPEPEQVKADLEAAAFGPDQRRRLPRPLVAGIARC